MLFSKEFLKESIWDSKHTISDEIIGTRRWSVDHERIFKFENKFYSTIYSTAATECQDESPYEDEDDLIECEEVFPVEVKTIVYKSAKEIAK